MSGIGDQGLRPAHVEPGAAPDDESAATAEENAEAAEENTEPAEENADTAEGSAETEKTADHAEHISEPSTEKSLDEEPKAPATDEPEPSHQAVGIGVIGGPQTLVDPTADS